MKNLVLAVAISVTVTGHAFAETGIASVYSTREQGSKTASGRPLNDGALTAAHKSLPFGTRVRVSGLAHVDVERGG